MYYLSRLLKSYNFSNKNLDYLSTKTFEDLLLKHGLTKCFPPNFAIYDVVDNIVLCRNLNNIHPAVKLRAITYVDYINRLINKFCINFPSNSSFIIDISDGCPHRSILEEIPTVCLSASVPNTKTIPSLPFSDVHYLLPKYKKNFLGVVYDSDFYKKKNMLSWRGSPHPTLNPYVPTACSKWINSRLNFCKRYFNHPKIDAGFCFKNSNSAIWRVPYLEFEKESLTKEQMGESKLIANITGIASSYDAPFWIMQSGSVMLWIIQNEFELARDNSPLWIMWYYDLLEPYIHYIPSTIDKVEENIEWCFAHPDECKKITVQARNICSHILSIWDESNAMILKCIIDNSLIASL
jgi:hypothetical protein